jgi:hypothetical protein
MLDAASNSQFKLLRDVLTNFRAVTGWFCLKIKQKNPVSFTFPERWVAIEF